MPTSFHYHNTAHTTGYAAAATFSPLMRAITLAYAPMSRRCCSAAFIAVALFRYATSQGRWRALHHVTADGDTLAAIR